MGLIPAIPNAQNTPLLLCHELFNEASLPDDYLTDRQLALLKIQQSQAFCLVEMGII